MNKRRRFKVKHRRLVNRYIEQIRQTSRPGRYKVIARMRWVGLVP